MERQKDLFIYFFNNDFNNDSKVHLHNDFINEQNKKHNPFSILIDLFSLPQ